MPTNNVKPLLLKTVKEQIAAGQGLDPKWIDEDVTLENLGLDSLDIAELSMRIEMEMTFYAADPHAWIIKTDTPDSIAIKLEARYNEYKRKHPDTN